MIEITKKFTFEAAHQLKWHKGKCINLHGHTYKLRVSVNGEVNENGIIVDFTDLKEVVNSAVINKLDHTFLNDIIDNPTAENLVVWIWKQLKPKIHISEIRLYETPTSYATYRE